MNLDQSVHDLEIAIVAQNRMLVVYRVQRGKASMIFNQASFPQNQISIVQPKNSL